MRFLARISCRTSVQTHHSKEPRSFEWHERGDIINYDEHALVTFDAVAAILLHPTYAVEATTHALKSF